MGLMATILLVEDDDAVREALSMVLEADGHRVHEAADGDAGMEAWRARRPELILLDAMIGQPDGFEVCRRIRTADDGVSIIMLTALSDPIDMVAGLESGADDYVTKPFDMRVLTARIKAVLRRRHTSEPPSVLSVGDLVIDEGAVRVSRGGQPLQLTPTEFRLLAELARRPGHVCSRQLLLERVWEYDHLGDSRLVDTCVQQVRSKIEIDPGSPMLLHTVRGVGYKVEP